jgi:hypothetical protein
MMGFDAMWACTEVILKRFITFSIKSFINHATFAPWP